MDQRHLSRVSPRLIALFQYLQATAKQIFANLFVGDCALSDLGEFRSCIKRFLRLLGFKCKEFCKANWYAVQYPFQRSYRWIRRIRFD